MTWQLMWRNVRVAALNATLQLLVIYRFVETFYGKRKKKQLNFMIAFYISYKSGIKSFLKWSINKFPKAPVNMIFNKNREKKKRKEKNEE